MPPRIEVTIDDQISVFTSANASTGYVVALKELPACVYLIGQEYIHDHLQLRSGSGKTILRCVAVTQGEGPIGLRHMRPWENPPEESPEEPAMPHQLDHCFVKVT